MRFSAAIVGADLSVYAYVIQLFPHCIFPVLVFSFLSFFRFILPFAPLASYVTLQAFISLQGKLIAWGNLKKNVAGDTSGLASLIEHLHMNRGETARHVRGGRSVMRNIRQTSAFQMFLTHF